MTTSQYGLWPYVVAVVDYDAQHVICCDCAKETYGATFDALVENDETTPAPENLGVILGDSEDLLDIDKWYETGDYVSRTCDKCGAAYVDTSGYAL